MMYVNIYITKKEKFNSLGHNISCELQDIEYCLKDSFSEAKPNEIDYIISWVNNTENTQNTLYTSLGECSVEVSLSYLIKNTWTIITPNNKSYTSSNYKKTLNKLNEYLNNQEIIKCSIPWNKTQEYPMKENYNDILVSLQTHGGTLILTYRDLLTNSVHELTLIHFIPITHEDVIDIKNANMEI